MLYVEELIGPDTVNTMPPATVEAFRDHGRAELTLERDVDGARETLRRLAELGIDLDAITTKLQVDGVAAFADSYNQMMAAVEQKRQSLLEESPQTVAAT